MVAHKSSNLSETNTNMVSYIIDTTTPKTPLYETTQQAEGKSLLNLRQSPSACPPVVPVALMAERRFCRAEAQGSSPCGHIPAVFVPFSLPDNNGAGIFHNSQNTTTFTCADSNEAKMNNQKIESSNNPKI